MRHSKNAKPGSSLSYINRHPYSQSISRALLKEITNSSEGADDQTVRQRRLAFAFVAAKNCSKSAVDRSFRVRVGARKAASSSSSSTFSKIVRRRSDSRR